jgi:hypothetical protein
MKKLFIIIFFFSSVSSLLSHSQTIDETIVYINNMSRGHYYSFYWTRPFNGSTTKSESGGIVTANDYDYIKEYYNFSLASNGLLTIHNMRDNYILPAGTVYSKDLSSQDWLKQLINQNEVFTGAYVYIKQLSDTVIIKNPYTKTSDDYVLILSCNNDCNCILHKYSPNILKNYEIHINGQGYALRVKNALEYLIKLAKKNTSYLEKDPFE